MGYGLSVVRPHGEITEQEWAAYVAGADDLSMTDEVTATNPATREVVRVSVPGLAVWEDRASFRLSGGAVVTDSSDEGGLRRLARIASDLGGRVEGEEGETYSMVGDTLEVD